MENQNEELVQVENQEEKKPRKGILLRKKKPVLFITQVAILAAISIVLYYFPKFQLPFFPSFLSVQFSMLPAIIASFALGPVGGVIVVVIKFLFKVVSTRSAAVGELADLLIGLSVVISSGLVYNIKRNRSSAFFALITTILVWIISAALLNYFLLIPTYVKLYGLAPVLGMLKKIPGVDESNYLIKYIFYACIPFNAMLSVTVSIVTLLVYKRISFLFKKMEK